jgi:hypothetical protein
MQELTATQWASPPVNWENSASKALFSGPWVRISPASTRRTASRSLPVIHGFAN